VTLRERQPPIKAMSPPPLYPIPVARPPFRHGRRVAADWEAPARPGEDLFALGGMARA
jgi:hypothetical protein